MMNRPYSWLNMRLMAVAILLTAFTACEIPQSPDFSTDSSLDITLLNKRFTFLGGPDALIDTTGGNFDSLFTVEGDGLITLSRLEEFNFDDLSGAIPAVNIDPTTIDNEIGQIGFSNFTSGSGNVGEASFSRITGLNPSLVPAGFSIPGGSSPTVRIDLETSNFISATIAEDGSINITITNDLGFTIDVMTLALLSNGNQVGSTLNFNNIEDDEQRTGSLNFSPGDRLAAPLEAEVELSWSAQTISSDGPGPLEVNSVVGSGLFFSEVEAVVDRQDFSSTSETAISADELRFNSDDDFIELESGRLVISEISNGIDLTIDRLQISFPGILISENGNEPTPADSLVVLFSESNGNQIPRSDVLNDSVVVDLTNARITATNNEIDYSIQGFTEDSRDSQDSIRTLTSNAAVSATLEIRNLAVARARGTIVPTTILLNEDDSLNGVNQLDLFNDTEATVVEIDALANLSGDTDSLEFLNPELLFNYTYNIGVETEIYGAILGQNSNGNIEYLTGLPGSRFDVTNADTVGGFFLNGLQIPNENLIKFTLDRNGIEADPQSGSIVFNRTNSTISDFISNLPYQIRFVGKALVNPQNTRGTIVDPVEIDGEFGIDVPLELGTSSAPAVLSDTVDLGSTFNDLPKEGDDQQITEATLFINYENGLPLTADTLTIEFLDTSRPPSEQVLFAIPDLAAGDDTRLLGGMIGGDLFVDTPAEGSITITINRQKALLLREADALRIDVPFLSSDPDGVKIRADDYIRFEVGVRVQIELTVSN